MMMRPVAPMMKVLWFRSCLRGLVRVGSVPQGSLAPVRCLLSRDLSFHTHPNSGVQSCVDKIDEKVYYHEGECSK